MSDIQQAVRDKYGAIATAVAASSTKADCCGPTACGCGDPITSNLYSDAETSGRDSRRKLVFSVRSAF